MKKYKVENCEHTLGQSISATTPDGVVLDPSESLIDKVFEAKTVEDAERLAFLELSIHIAVEGLKLKKRWFDSVAITMKELKTCQNCKKNEATERENNMDLCKQCVQKIANALRRLRDDRRINESMYGNPDGGYNRDEYWDRKK
jgi:phosphotransferase system IIA component